MADETAPAADPNAAAPAAGEELDGGTYEIIRNRLLAAGETLRERLDQLNEARKATFGAIETRLLTTERITTSNNCIPRDMVPLGDRFLFGYNVHLGLRTETTLADVFAVYTYAERAFREEDLACLEDDRFRADFRELYRYYKQTRFAKFAQIGPYLHMVFRVGKDVRDVKTFKWQLHEDGHLKYIDGRSEHEYRYPPQHEFEWVRTTRDMHRGGEHPHISIEDRLFVETVGGDLTVKIEDNTDSGEGIYCEPVADPDQTLDDAEVYYAVLGNLVLLKIRPYQEEAFRHLVFNAKVQQCCRIDAIADACVLLPEDHGIIFPKGYYLQTGEYKTFENDLEDMVFERRVSAPNGEDTLFAFYNRESGAYILLFYNLIEQAVATPIVCHGWSLFENGEMTFFRGTDEPQKYHAIQIWQTPFVGPNYVAPTQDNSYLFKIGNRDIVRCMAACRGVLGLIGKEESYANLYLDLVRQCTDLLDTYFWLDQEAAANLREPLTAIRNGAAAAVEEYEKVVRVRRNTRERVGAVSHRTREIVNTIARRRFESIGEFVDSLTQLRAVRGEIIALRDLRYVDLDQVAAFEAEVEEETGRLAGRCVDFLLTPAALAPYEERVEALRGTIDDLPTVTEARETEEAIAACGAELEMLIDVVSNLKIDDATQRTAIIDNISAIYSILNQVRSALKNRIQSLATAEGQAEFASQMKLLNQAVVNYLDVCDTPEKAEAYLTKLMVQVEELEGRFADFDDFVVALTAKREEVYNAFESRKLQLVEVRNKRATALLQSAERVLKGIQTRAEQMESVSEINGYFAADLMVDKVRDIIRQLTELGDSVKAGDVQSRLKTIQQDTVRQLKDRQELFVAGEDVVRFGNHHFAVNTQALDLTVVQRDDEMCLHLTGTDFFAPITDPAFLATQAVWNQEMVSETGSVYRGEYLAYQLFRSLQAADRLRTASRWNEAERAAAVRDFMSPRYAEQYVKGVHDVDAGRILEALVQMEGGIGRLRYHTRSRALARVFWQYGPDDAVRQSLAAAIGGYGAAARLFKRPGLHAGFVGELTERLERFVEATGLLEAYLVPQAAAYLFEHLATGDGHTISPLAGSIYTAFQEHLQKHAAAPELDGALATVRGDGARAFALALAWVESFLEAQAAPAAEREHAAEVAALLLCGDYDTTCVASTHPRAVLDAMVGNHPLLADGRYELDYNNFMLKLDRYTQEQVPSFEQFLQAKKDLVEAAREEMRLAEFMPRVLTSFVRNRLLDKVYLPLVGDNLAKQIGVVGEAKRTDLMGLLLLVSPPGYGKTTLMEYIANRLGIIFMKINGPAIGHGVTSLDPAEAPNASAREELEKLNLAFEMGDNVMIYVDDIQHTNPEFLQKFISLCDGQRKIEGVYKGRTRTYDLRGKKVCVVMAGNPYTESGDKFRIPDMLANRADTYNLGDIIGDNADAFKLSYIENALTSNPVLGKLATRSREDVYAIVRIAETGSREGVELEGTYSAEELSEFVGVMEKLLRVRDVILTVNQAYIASAAQADEFRTEPPFKLQGSYRNMNRIAEKVLPVMNAEELEALLLNHYENEAQTLTSGAEANLLKFRELTGQLDDAGAARWAAIRQTFQRHQLTRGVGDDDRAGQVVMQLATFREGLDAIGEALRSGVDTWAAHAAAPETAAPVEAALTAQTLEGLRDALAAAAPAPPPGPAALALPDEALEALEDMLAKFAAALAGLQSAPAPARPAAAPVPAGALPKIEVVNKVPRGMLHVLQQQFKLMQEFMTPLLAESREQGKELDELRGRLETVLLAYENLMDQIEHGNASRHRRRAPSRRKKKGDG